MRENTFTEWAVIQVIIDENQDGTRGRSPAEAAFPTVQCYRASIG